MKKIKLIIFITPLLLLPFLIINCTSKSNTNQNKVKKEMVNFEQGTYGYDKAFLKNNDIEIIELKDEHSQACVLLTPGYQGRVMTSSAAGNEGLSFGWINYKLIGSGQILKHFNPVGGEERFWLGPEGGPFSVYFEKGKEQVYDNWLVPPVLDTERFEIKEQSMDRVLFVKNTEVKNALGNILKMSITRSVKILSKDSLAEMLNINTADKDLNIVAYQSDNTITNTGSDPWEKETGLLSVWMLCMFNPSASTTVFLPYNTEGTGTIVNDDYFGKVPSDRLVIEHGTVFFKIDGQYRSKIGLPGGRAKELCGSYDYEKNILTLLWHSLPSEPGEYLNSKWGIKDNLFDGDVINAYNDGPVEDGSVMGPFYEIETSSQAAKLKPGESLTHTQRVIHIQGEEEELNKITDQLFNLDLMKIKAAFN
jgi:hypothetical protein